MLDYSRLHMMASDVLSDTLFVYDPGLATAIQQLPLLPRALKLRLPVAYLPHHEALL